MTIRLIQIAMLGCIALFFSLVTYNNLNDASSNLPAVQHVLSMDTTFHIATLMKRAITNPAIHRGAFYLITIWELLTAIVCWIACIRLIIARKASPDQFKQAKNTAFLGLFLGFVLYMFGFIIIADEWFSMWQSPTWNVQAAAGLFTSLILLIMIFLGIS